MPSKKSAHFEIRNVRRKKACKSPPKILVKEDGPYFLNQILSDPWTLQIRSRVKAKVQKLSENLCYLQIEKCTVMYVVR